MELISQIINELVDDEKSLNSALLKTKVLASQIQSIELLNWANKELSGYESINELPEYRKTISTYLRGSYIAGNMKYTNHPIPTIGLDKIYQDNLQFTNFFESISSLESLIKTDDSTTLSSPLKAEMVATIQQNWIEMGNPSLQLLNVKKIISKNSIVEIISKVRNKLLDFMLKVDSEFGKLTEISKLNENKILNIMNQTIINTSGDGNVVSTGDKAKIDIKININKGNKDELSKQLSEIGINQKDSAELLEIIDTEEPNKDNKTFGKKVNIWTAKMLNKALDGSWNVGIGAAGSLLAETIGKYYGINP